jgi:hypothetical protein
MATKEINPATGRPFKTGGRKKGSKNLVSTQIKKAFKKGEQEAMKQVLDEGNSPLAYLFSVWTNEELDEKLRIDAARAGLPYIHGKKPVVTEITGRDGAPIEFSTAAARNQLRGLLFEGTASEVLEHKDEQDAVIEGVVQAQLAESIEEDK